MRFDTMSHSEQDMLNAIHLFLEKKEESQPIVFFCIGSDLSVYDSLGPLVGTFLSEAGYTNVIGTLEDTANALNMNDKIDLMYEEYEDPFVIAIDCSVSPYLHKILITDRALEPGAALGKNLPCVGDISIEATAITEIPLGQYTGGKLRHTYQLARRVVEMISSTIPIE